MNDILNRNILRKNGSAADAAIAIQICDGATSPATHGMGGGFVATIYTRSNRFAESLIARETAPAAANSTMFANATAVNGGMAVAVPGELKGFAELHQRYGRLNWADLVRPTVDLCRNGFKVTQFLAMDLQKYKSTIMGSAELREIFVNPLTNELYHQGENMIRLKLAETLALIADQGADAMYSSNGVLGLGLVEDIKRLGGILTQDDLMDYRVQWKRPVQTIIYGDLTLYSTPLPASGSVLAFIMNFVDEFLPTNGSLLLFYSRIIESFKHAYAKRTQLGDAPEADEITSRLTDPNYAKEIRKSVIDGNTSQEFSDYDGIFADFTDHGTSNVAVLAANGDAVCITSTINTRYREVIFSRYTLIIFINISSFGAKIVSTSTGILLNDQMDDFSTPGINNAYGLPPSPANFIVPGRRPMSSMSPSIIVKPNGDVRMVVGAAGGTRITTSVALVIHRTF